MALSYSYTLTDGTTAYGSQVQANFNNISTLLNTTLLDGSYIQNGALTNAHLSSSAAIDYSKLATLTAGNVVLGNASNVATSTALTGDVTVTSGGVTAIGASKVTNAMLAGSIAYSKLSLTGAILNADLAGSIAYSKLSLTNSIVAGDLTSDSITTAKITDANVTTAKLADGAVTPVKVTNNYAFRAFAASSASVGATTFSKVGFGTEDYDDNNNFASSTYTAPVAGIYHFDFAVNGNTSIGAQTRYLSNLYKNGSLVVQTADVTMPATHFAGWHGAVDLKLAANDTIEVYVWSGNNTDYAAGTTKTWFSGHLVRQG